MFRSRHWICVLLAAIAIPPAGCATFTAQKDLLPGEDDLAGLADGPRVTIELRPEGKRPETTQMPLQGTMYVQQTLDYSGATKRFRRMNIEVLRPSAGGQQKLTSKYMHTKAMVDPGYDYALYPGDHVVVVEDPTTIVEDMLGPLAGPLQHLGKN